jgi:hypothetical protein
VGNPEREPVIICTLLDESKAAIIPRIAARWRELDFGGRPVAVIACSQDASKATKQAFAEAVGYTAVFVESPNVDKRVPGSDKLAKLAQEGTYSNVIFMHRLALLREAVRVQALKARFDQGPAKWFFWLDSDVDPRPDDAFLRLHKVLTATRGPQKPRTACGIYASRHWGGDINSKWIGEGAGLYVPLRPHRVQVCRVAGFGCALIPREVMARIGWGGYETYRAHRRDALELDPANGSGVLGEDIFWFWQLEQAGGAPPWVDTDVRCRHYQADGTFWRYEEHENGFLHAVYVTDDRDEAATIRLVNDGPDPIEFACYNLSIQPGAEASVSPEVWNAIEARKLKARRVA